MKRIAWTILRGDSEYGKRWALAVRFFAGGFGAGRQGSNLYLSIVAGRFGVTFAFGPPWRVEVIRSPGEVWVSLGWIGGAVSWEAEAWRRP